MLQPGKASEIDITFVPTAAKEYSAAMPLRIMGLYDINIPLKGKWAVCLMAQELQYVCSLSTGVQSASSVGANALTRAGLALMHARRRGSAAYC